MNRHVLICVICSVTAFLTGMKIGWDIHRPPKCPECPEIVPQTLIERDSSVRQPTVTLTVPREAVKTGTQYQQAFQRVPTENGSGSTLKEAGETLNCWNIEATAPDSARMAVQLCSRAFTLQPPADLMPTIEYTAPPKVRVIERTNNVFQPCPDPPKPKHWGLTVGPYLGVGVDILGQPRATLGLGISWGYRIRAR